jgi:hypothetical protein
MTKSRELTQQNFDAIRNQLFDRIHKTGEEMKNDFPNKLRRAIETEAWRHFSDADGKPFENLVDWLAYTFPNGASMGQGKDAITYEEALKLCEGHPEVHRVLAGSAPRAKPGRKPNGAIGYVRTQLDRHGRTATKALLLVRLAQEKPDFYEAFMRKEYASLRAAAEAAGLLKRANDPLPRLKSFWSRATAVDKKAFLKWIQSADAKPNKKKQKG